MQAFDVLARVDNLLEVGVLTAKEDGIVDHDAVNGVVCIGSNDQILNIGLEVKVGRCAFVLLLLDLDRVVPCLPDLKLDADGLARLARPFRVGYAGGTRSRQDTDELGSRLALVDACLDGLLDGILEGRSDARCLDELSGVLSRRHGAGLRGVLNDGFGHAASYTTKDVVGLNRSDRVALAVKG